MNSHRKLCLILDNSYMPRSITTTERGFVVVYKGNAEIIETYDEFFKTIKQPPIFKKPSIIRIDAYVKMEYKELPLRRDYIYKRDNYECVYCGNSNKKLLTLDHVIPKAKGGKDKWDNLVTCCSNCNNEKADLTLEEWGRPDPKPKRPHYLMMLKKAEGSIPEGWKKYLFI